MKNWIKLSIVILIFISISLCFYFTFKLLGISDFESIKLLALNSGKLGIVVYSLIMTIFLTFLCFVPLLNSSLLVLAFSLFGPIKTIIICVTANFVSSSLLFFIGDKFGEPLAKKIVGASEFERVQNLLDTKTQIYLPLMYLIPGFPDEALALLAGMTKIRYIYLISVSTIYHALEAIVFCIIGKQLIAFSSINPIECLILLNLIIIDIFLLSKIENKIKNKKTKK